MDLQYIDPIQREITLLGNDNNRLESIRTSLFREPYFYDPNHVYAIGIIGDTHGYIQPAKSRLDSFVKNQGISLDACFQIGDLFDTPFTENKKLGFDSLANNEYSEMFRNLQVIRGNHDENWNQYGFHVRTHQNGTVHTLESKYFDFPIGILGWDSTSSEILDIKSQQLPLVLTHERLPKVGSMQLFGHHKNALELSNNGKQHYGLEHTLHKSEPLFGSTGIVFYNGDKSFFLYTPSKF